MADHVFETLPSVPDHPALEREILEWWGRERIFDRLREQNAEGPKWSFIDGPITANNPMGVHHAWGRTLKDVFQRYKALRGFRQRYQNGFDCQGLWVEVEVEKSLGLNSKREIEEYGLAEFAARCRERVAHYAEVITEQSRQLGMWMDWDNDYYTFSDTNIEYIWRFLKAAHERGWLYLGHRSTPWCPRCGTSISQHELFAGEYQELDHPSLYVRFPLKGRDGEALLVWTTTPWTLPANVAAALKPDAEYVLRDDGGWVVRELAGDAQYSRSVRGEELVGLEYEGPFDDLDAQQGIVHRVIPWDDVSLEEGTGIVHIAPGAGTEDFELSRVHDLPVLVPIDEAGILRDGYGVFTGLSTEEVEEPVIEELRRRELLAEAGRIVHRYPTCWRCGTPLVFRVVDDWFIACDEIRQPMLDANATVEWTPAFYSKRMDDWLRNMGDWNISRKRYFGLPLPLYPCSCGHLNVIGSRAELEERATTGLDGLQELHRPWIDDVLVRCEQCGEEVRRIPEVGDAWLDAGIVPFATLGWQNPEWKPGGYATGAAAGLTGADLPDHPYWEEWFAAEWVSEMREQIRLWFYSLSFMSVTLVGQSPYMRVLTYEKLLDETGREMHRSWGNAIEVDEALDRMGADVMRWQFCEAPPHQNIKFGYGPAHEVRRRLLTFWNSVGFLVTYANIEGFRPRYLEAPSGGRPLDRWLVARTHAFLAAMEAAYERFWTPAAVTEFESFVDDVSNWYIRRSRRRFYSFDETTFQTLWYALVQALRAVAPMMPFLADHLWRVLVAGPCEKAPGSVFLAGWPEARERDEALLAEVAEARRVVELGRQARAGSGLKLRQPLRRLVVQGTSLSEEHAAEVREELRVKEVEQGEVEAEELVVKPNLPVLGPRLGKELGAVRSALAAGEYEQVDGGFRVAGHELGPDDVLVERRGKEGWALASDGGITVALDTRLDDELVLEARVLDLIHRLNTMRREAGLELTDRIVVTLPPSESELLAHAEWIKGEVLAIDIRLDGGSGEPQIAKA
ncbi:MAG TPA: isoleucine--tRNA ligase [Gaiellaceae bacterium]|nr:isoleucine--tRNA ligase [Gaiellaceae bacterium]